MFLSRAIPFLMTPALVPSVRPPLHHGISSIATPAIVRMQEIPMQAPAATMARVRKSFWFTASRMYLVFARKDQGKRAGYSRQDHGTDGQRLRTKKETRGHLGWRPVQDQQEHRPLLCRPAGEIHVDACHFLTRRLTLITEARMSPRKKDQIRIGL